ncbi:translation initiation factor IF-2 subunit gamma [Candidatus Woesearchaeota archaeon]|nr:translation initiation factor IF-2 subunit gamma [Candidatus Woesearchaeota archaeon]
MPRKKKEDSEKTGSDTESSAQPVINIGMIGHVDHGKTTLTECLSGKWTDTHSEELKKGITIRLGYANCSFYTDAKKKNTDSYTVDEMSSDGKTKNKLIRKISLVDAPGHESLMATMLAGATIMDGALLLVAANEICPQPQTFEHLKALEIMGIKNVIVVQNKIDLVSEEEALENYEQIKKFLERTSYKDAPIVPISAQYKVNIDFLIETIEKTIPTPERDLTKSPKMFIARSFDINKPGVEIAKMVGGVIGGAVQQGKFVVGDEIEIRPGYEVEERNQKIFKPIKTKIIGLMSGKDKIEEATPGGSIAIMTTLDPNVVKSDRLTGNLVGKPGELPETLYNIELETSLLERVVGTKEELQVEPIKKGEILMLNVNSASTVGMVVELGKNKVKCQLKIPVCAANGSRVTISRVVHSRFRLIGFGTIC